MAGISRVGSAFSTLPFDGIDNITNYFWHDDFVGADNSNVFLSTNQGNWLTTTTAVTAADGEEDHPGIVIVEASFLTPGDVDSHPGFLLSDNPLYLAAILRVPDVSTDGPIVFGLNDNVTDVIGDVNATFIGLTMTSAGAFELEYLATGETDYDIVVDDNDWFMVELSIDDAGVYGRVTTENGSETRYTAAGAAATASISVLDATGTVHVDAWHERFRRPLGAANSPDGIPWLG